MSGGNGAVQVCEDCFDSSHTFKLHVGIDFGTDGTAISFIHDEQPDIIHVHDKWLSKRPRKTDTYMDQIKPKTAILVDTEKNVIAFGKRAIEIYLSAEEEMQQKWMLFDGFKMSLMRKETPDCEVTTSNSNSTSTTNWSFFDIFKSNNDDKNKNKLKS
jgi:molecular chaperone DnaK (HSP70)